MAPDTLPDSQSRAHIDTLLAVVRRWKFILGWTLAVTILAGALSFLRSETYRATAQLLINPSPYKSSTLEQAPLEVDTYQEMLRDAAVVKAVKDRLELEDLTVEGLRRSMRVSVIRRPSVRETTYAPLLLLHVTGPDPERCQTVANTWAELATSISLDLKTSVIKRDTERIRKQFEDTRRVLEAKEEKALEFDIASQLEERKAELEVVRKQLSAEQENLERLRLEYGVARTRLEDLKHKYDSFFVDGVWVGSLGGGDRGTTAALDPEGLDPLARQFLEARNALLDKAQALARYKIRERVGVVETSYEDLTRRIDRLAREINDSRIRLERDRAKVQQLETEIETVPQHLVVSKAITDEALWLATASDAQALDEATSKRLTSQAVNPVWLGVHQRLAYLKPEVQGLAARLASEQQRLGELRDEQAALYAQTARQEQEMENFETELSLAQERYEALSRVFLLISEDIMFEEADVARLRAEIANSEEQVDRLTSTSLALNEYTVTKTLEKERLQRDLDSLKKMYTALGTKYEEARITELEVSGDLQIALAAPRPEEGVGADRLIVVAAAFLGALILFSLVAVAREYVGQQMANAQST